MRTPPTTDHIETSARKRAGAKLGWYLHLAVYVLVNLFIFAISGYGFSQRLWTVFPLLGWGVGVALHGVAVFVLGPGSGLRERMVHAELDHLRRQCGS